MTNYIIGCIIPADYKLGQEPKEHAVIKAIVIQTASGSAEFCTRIAVELGLTFDKVRICSETDPWIEDEYIQPGEEQLLVIGTIHGDGRAADRYVSKLKAKNPMLRAWFCSSLVGWGDPPLYERSIPQRYEQLMTEVKKFVDGLLPLPS